jgi:cupin 2 domain-containing protein
MSAASNLFAGLPGEVSAELFDVLVATPNVKIERIVSRGHVTAADAWYDQPTHEWVVVLRGAAEVQFEDQGPVRLASGDHLNIPAHARHRVTWTDPDETTVWLAVHYG